MGVVVELEQPPSGSPQLEDGYLRIANELLDKIIRFDFSKRQYQVLLFIIRKTYGYRKKVDQISYSQIEAATGLDHSAAVKTVSELVAMHVVSKQHGQHAQVIGINKNYLEWVLVSKQHPSVKTTLRGCQNDTKRGVKTTPTKDKPKNNTKRHIPSDFKISDQVREWATKNAHTNLDAHLDWFVDWAKANRKQYADWDATFRNAIRGNWAKLKIVEKQRPIGGNEV